MKFLTELFAWWTGNTIGTRLFTWRFGTRVGEDALVPPEWHGWLHYTVDVPPTEESYHAQPWQKPYVPNLTGSPQAYRPPGSILNPDAGKTRQRDYEPWRPGPSK
jgi:NADH:ubiquinone oxidoreductase subunit